jgi:hypothetical protein
MKKFETTICYLCGKPLNPPTNVDHPVMQQLFAPELRRKHNVQLITFDVHQACNFGYRSDEDYFVRSLLPFARGSVAGNAIYGKALKDFRAGKQVPLMTMVLGEFDANPSGLLLPGGKVAKRFAGKRIARVAWKIVRGLHFHHTGEVLPENWPTLSVQLFPLTETTPPEITLPSDVLAFASWAPSRGRYPGVLDYKFENSPRLTTCTIGCCSCGIGSSSGCTFTIQTASAKPVCPRAPPPPPSRPDRLARYPRSRAGRDRHAANKPSIALSEITRAALTPGWPLWQLPAPRCLGLRKSRPAFWPAFSLGSRC